MSQFLPRSLNQVADHEIRKLAEGDVEDTYALAVAALTGNAEVVEAHVRKTGRKETKSVQSILLKSDEDKVQSNTVKFEDEDAGSVVESEDDSSGELSDEDSDDEEGPRFIKVARTPEQLHAEKLATREMRKANKKTVKDASTVKRKEKIKKKDKKRAINKSKAGNKKK